MVPRAAAAAALPVVEVTAAAAAAVAAAIAAAGTVPGLAGPLATITRISGSGRAAGSLVPSCRRRTITR